MKTSSISLSIATAVLATAVFTIATAAQTPPAPQQPAASGQRPPRMAPAPTNLKVLPKTMTGEQVHELMEKWEASLGAKCSTCHAADPNNMGPNGRPRLNFADDSKEEKQTARLMYKMTEDINMNYVSKVPSSDTPVTCGTCHRGHLGPEPFVIPEEGHDHDHPGPPPPGTAPTAH